MDFVLFTYKFNKKKPPPVLVTQRAAGCSHKRKHYYEMHLHYSTSLVGWQGNVLVL